MSSLEICCRKCPRAHRNRSLQHRPKAPKSRHGIFPPCLFAYNWVVTTSSEKWKASDPRLTCSMVMGTRFWRWERRVRIPSGLGPTSPTSAFSLCPYHWHPLLFLSLFLETQNHFLSAEMRKKTLKNLQRCSLPYHWKATYLYSLAVNALQIHPI